MGDEKARDKTSQALRENSMSVRRQMEEEFNETRRQQARETAIAAGRDPVSTQSVEYMSCLDYLNTELCLCFTCY